MDVNAFNIGLWSAIIVVACFVFTLLWMGERVDQRRARLERESWMATEGNGLAALEIGMCYRVLFRAREPIEGLRYVGNTGHDFSDPLCRRLVFENQASRRVIIKAGLIQIFETMPN